MKEVCQWQCLIQWNTLETTTVKILRYGSWPGRRAISLLLCVGYLWFVCNAVWVWCAYNVREKEVSANTHLPVFVCCIIKWQVCRILRDCCGKNISSSNCGPVYLILYLETNRKQIPYIKVILQQAYSILKSNFDNKYTHNTSKQWEFWQQKFVTSTPSWFWERDEGGHQQGLWLVELYWRHE